jgi:hypothetical protein
MAMKESANVSNDPQKTQTWRAREVRQGRDNGIRRKNCVVSDLGAVFDNSELPLKKMKISLHACAEIYTAGLTITQFLPISTWLPMVAASTTVPEPIWTWSPTLMG